VLWEVHQIENEPSGVAQPEGWRAVYESDALVRLADHTIRADDGLPHLPALDDEVRHVLGGGMEVRGLDAAALVRAKKRNLGRND